MMIYETAIQNQNYSATENLTQQILADNKIVDCVILSEGDTSVIAVITKPIYFISQLRELTAWIATTVANYSEAENIYVTRDTDIYCDIKKLSKLSGEKEKTELTRKIINKVTKREAYENN